MSQISYRIQLQKSLPETGDRTSNQTLASKADRFQRLAFSFLVSFINFFWVFMTCQSLNMETANKQAEKWVSSNRHLCTMKEKLCEIIKAWRTH
jgi:hypothetical protein